jgi:hypothetical protein
MIKCREYLATSSLLNWTSVQRLSGIILAAISQEWET